MLALCVGALSVVGVPPTCGFFSKWFLLLGGVQAGQWEFVAALIFSSLVNAVLFYRVFEVAFSQSEEGPSLGFENSRILDAPPMMIPPLVVVTVALLAIGLSAGPFVREVIRFAIPAL